MQSRLFPNPFALILVICLGIGIVSNLTGILGVSILLVGLLLAATIRLLGPQLARITNGQLKIILIVGLMLMMIGQILVAHFMPVTVYHDPYRVLAQADQMAAGHNVWNITYFWRYTNNVPLTYLLSLWLRLMTPLGASTNLAIHLLSMLMLDAFITISLLTVHQLSRRNSTVLGAFAFFALTPFAYTYYLQVFYSDLPLQLLLLIMLRIVWRWSGLNRKQHIIQGGALVIVSLLGIIIKANLIVILPAMLLIGLFLPRHSGYRRTQLLIPTLLILCGFALSIPTTKAIQQAADYTPRSSYEFPASSWILMGLNAKRNGMYSGADTGRQVRMSSKQARQQYNAKAIQRRVRRLGFSGLLQLWLKKIAVLLNVHGIQGWYNGGFADAPAWYQRCEQPLHIATTISYTVATIALWACLIWRLISWRPRLNTPKEIATLLGVITALGFIAFHTLLWEAEPRYGQVLIPLGWFIFAAIPARQHQSLPIKQTRWLGAAASIITVLGLIEVSTQIGRTNPVTIAAAQRSQLSTQYHARPLTLAPGSSMTQCVPISGPADYFSVQVYHGSVVHATLRNLTTDRQYVLHQSASVYSTHQSLRAGNYRMTITNETSTPQRVAVVRTTNYRLAPGPLVQNGHAHLTASFIYLFINHHQEAAS